MIAREDDRELLEWLANADLRGNSFVSSLAHAALVADHEDYPVIRPAIVKLREKYTQFEAPLKVKLELQQEARIAGNSHP